MVGVSKLTNRYHLAEHLTMLTHVTLQRDSLSLVYVLIVLQSPLVGFNSLYAFSFYPLRL